MANYFELIDQFERNLQSLNKVLLGRDTDSVFIDGEEKPSISKDISDRFKFLTLGQRGGVVAFMTKELLISYELPLEQRNSSFKVTNDPVAENNGYYSWLSGNNYIKESGLANGNISDGEQETVSGGAIFSALNPIRQSIESLESANETTSIMNEVVLSSSLSDDSAQYNFIPLDLSKKSKAFTSTFSGWRIPMLYDGHSFQLVKIKFGVENLDTVQLSVWNKDKVKIASAKSVCSGFGWTTFILERVITQSDLVGELFFLSLSTNSGSRSRLMPPTGNTWPASQRPDLNVNRISYSTSAYSTESWVDISAASAEYFFPTRFFLLSDVGSIFDPVSLALKPFVDGTTEVITKAVYESATPSAEFKIYSPNPRDQPFSGWASDYSRVSGESFNLLKIAHLRRTLNANSSTKWSFIRAFIYNPTNFTYLATATVQLAVNDSVTDIYDLEFALQDPATGQLITMNEANLPETFRVGYDAYNIDGTGAVVGDTRGTSQSYIGISWYRTTGNVGSNQWSPNSSNSEVPIERFLASNIVISNGYKIKASAIPYIPPIKHAPDIMLPNKLYFLQGLEGNIYFDNLMAESVKNYDIDVNCNSSARQHLERYRVLPTVLPGSYETSISVIDNATGELLTTKSTNLNVISKNARAGQSLNVMVIGDSLVNAGVITQTLIDNSSTDLMNVVLHGTRGTAPNLHEGRGGWTITRYITAGVISYRFNVSGVIVNPNINSTIYNFGGSTFKLQEMNIVNGSGTFVFNLESGSEPTGSGTLVKSSGVGDDSIAFSSVENLPANPFWVNGKLDYGQYQAINNMPEMDAVIIALGINDIFSQPSDAFAELAANTSSGYMNQLIGSIRAANPSCRIGISLPTPPANQDAFGFNYSNDQYSARSKRNIFIWNKVFNAIYENREPEFIYIVPSNLSLDTENNYPTITENVNYRNDMQVTRQYNGVHPANSGYQQIGDAWFSFLKSV